MYICCVFQLTLVENLERSVVRRITTINDFRLQPLLGILQTQVTFVSLHRGKGQKQTITQTIDRLFFFYKHLNKIVSTVSAVDRHLKKLFVLCPSNPL